MNSKQQTIVLAAGGTGGHIFPAEALAEYLLAHGHKVVLITDKRFAAYNNAGYNGVIGEIPVYYVQAGGSSGGLQGKVASAAKIFLGIRQAKKILKELKPDCVIGFGGYPSFPTVQAATSLGIRTIVHEQNAVLGRANRMVMRRVDAIATSYKNTQKLPAEQQSKAVHTGNPVRAAVKALRAIPYEEPANDGTLRILVMGGSQGARIFADVVPEAMKQLPSTLRKRIRIDQQCRKENLEEARAAYDELEMNVDLAPFFNDVPARLASAHCIITRAGASTTAELMVSGRPAIFIPLPSAMDNHQYYNALELEEANAAWLMPQEGFTPAALATRIESFLSAPSTLNKAAKAMKAQVQTDAAEQLAKLVLNEAGSNGNGGSNGAEAA